jgi:hypothetical protein
MTQQPGIVINMPPINVSPIINVKGGDVKVDSQQSSPSPSSVPQASSVPGRQPGHKRKGQQQNVVSMFGGGLSSSPPTHGLNYASYKYKPLHPYQDLDAFARTGHYDLIVHMAKHILIDEPQSLRGFQHDWGDISSSADGRGAGAGGECERRREWQRSGGWPQWCGGSGRAGQRPSGGGGQ